MTSQKDTTDHYRVLELPRDCTQKEISASYRRLALLHHPDKTSGDKSVANHFQQIQEAGEVLRDPECRRLYDKTLDLQSTSILHGYRKRYEPYDIRRNTNKSEAPEQKSDTPWNSKPPPEDYMYTWGSSVHMNLDSDWAQAEIARRAKEMDEWERVYAGIDPEVQKAENEYLKKFDEGQVSSEGEAMIDDGAGECGGLRPSSRKQTEEANEDGRELSHIDPEVQRSIERLYAYGLKGGVPSDDEDSSGDTGDLGWGKHDEGDDLRYTRYKDYLYDAESEAGSEYHSATSNVGPLIDLSDDDNAKDYKARPDISKENKAEPTEISKPATDNEDSSKGTDLADTIAIDEQNEDSVPGTIGCFIGLSDDRQDYEANPLSSKRHEAEPAEYFKFVTIKDEPPNPKCTEMVNVTAADEQGAGSTTGSIGCFIDLSDDEQDVQAIDKKKKPMSWGE
ncbi:uncharacterized protein N7503_006022 [Penicillium pulvis]|uniref:uncharacterized protein n=1 Tax=Penicillium pulvis TaxID=1562058 RepID=UPI002546B957|nr:uncharacterized protein N7503_006022 [Penicillium pulvis]KAJ5803572.1 hypothetical protein N7503_006022 [Penicillium pulvis]